MLRMLLGSGRLMLMVLAVARVGWPRLPVLLKKLLG